MRKAILLLAGGNILGKLTGAARELMVAALYGTGEVIASFRLAQNATLIPFHLIVNDSLLNAFVPTYRRAIASGDGRAPRFAAGVLLFLITAAVLMAVVLTAGARTWVQLQAPTLDPELTKLASHFLIVLGWSAPFYIGAAVINYVAMAHGEFATTAARPIFQNAGLIAGTVLSGLTGSVLWLAAGFTAAYVVYFLWVCQRLWIANLICLDDFLELRSETENFKRLLSTLKPLIAVPLVVQLGFFVERLVASRLGTTEVAAIDYARFLLETVTLVLSMPLGFAGLARWSGLRPEAMRLELSRIIASLFWISIPISILLYFCAADVVSLIFRRGAFGSDSVRVTGQILSFAALGLSAQIAGSIMLKALSAQFRNRELLLLTLGSVLVGMIVNLLASRYLGARGIGLAMTASGLVVFLFAARALSLGTVLLRRCKLVAGGAVLQLLLLCALASMTEGLALLLGATALSVLLWLLLASRDRLPIWVLATIFARR